MTLLAVVAGVYLTWWLWRRQRAWSLYRRCGQGHHQFTYSGEMHERPAFRSCLRCEYTEPTAPTTDAEYQSVNSLALVTHPDETEFDVQVMGEWGVAEEAIGFESNVTDIMQRRRA